MEQETRFWSNENLKCGHVTHDSGPTNLIALSLAIVTVTLDLLLFFNIW